MLFSFFFLNGNQNELGQLKNSQQKSGAQAEELTSLKKQLDERSRTLDETDRILKKRAADIEVLEQQLQNAMKQLNQQGNGANANSAAVIAQKEALVAELKNKLGAHEKEKQDIATELNRTREETKKVQSELDRLLKIMSASEEEKFSLNKQVQELQKELQNSLRQQQMRSQQAQQQQQQRPPNQGPQTQTTTQLANQHRRNSSTASKPPPQQPAPAPPQQQSQVRGAVPPRQGQQPQPQQNAAGPRPQGQPQGQAPRQAAPQNVNKPNQQPPKPPNQQQQQQQQVIFVLPFV